MCEVLPTIDEASPSPEEENTRLEQLMISMLEEREKMMNKLQETQEAYSETAHKLSQVEIDNNILMRQLQALLPKEEDQEALQVLLDELKTNGGINNDHMEEVQKWPIAAEIAALARELAGLKETVLEKEEEVQELKAERANMKLLLEHLECLVSRHERSLRVTVLKRQTANTGVSSEVEVLKALKSLFDHHKALDEKVRERLRAANERNTILEEELMLANQEIKSLHEEARRMKRLMAQRNSFRMSANYDAVGFTQEQLSMLQEKDQTISDLQFSLDERTAELDDAIQTRDEFTERVQEAEDELEIVLGDLHNTRTELSKLKQSLQSNQQESTSLLKQELASCQDQQSCLQVENQELNNHISLLETKLLKEEEISQNLKSELKQKDISLHQANSVREEQNRQISEQLTKAEQKQGSFEIRILELEEEIELKTQLLSSAQEKEKVNEEHIERLQNTVERMLKESNQRMKTHFAEKKSLMDERNSLNEKVDSLNSKLATSQHENLSMKDQLERLKRELQTAKQKLDDIQRGYRHSRVTDLDLAKTEYIKKRTNSEISNESDSQPGDNLGTDLDRGSWDFSEPGAVSRLMSILEGQVSVLDEQLQSIDEPSLENQFDSTHKPVLSDRGSGGEAPPPGSPPPPSPMRVSLRPKIKSETLPSSVYRVQTTDADIIPDISGGNTHHFSPTYQKHKSTKSTTAKGISSSVKKVFRRKSGNGTHKKSSPEKRNSAPAGINTTGSTPIEQQRTSLDLSEVTLLLEPAHSDSETRKKKADLVKAALEIGLPFSEWDSNLVMAWLEVWVGIPQWYVSALERNIQTGSAIESLTDAELSQVLGITNSMHRLKLKLALQEILSITTSRSLARTVPSYGDMTHDWISDYWLPSLGLPQYSDVFRICLVDARMLEHLTKKDLRTVLKMLDSTHRNSLQYGITVLKKVDYNKEHLERCKQDINSNKDVLLWSNEHVIRWVESIGLGDYATNLYESGVHGGVIALDSDFDSESLSLALKIPQTHQEIRRIVKMEFNSLLVEGTNRSSSESQSHGKIVRRISKRLKVGRRVPPNEFALIRPISPVLVSSSIRYSPIPVESTSSSPSQDGDVGEEIFKEMTV